MCQVVPGVLWGCSSGSQPAWTAACSHEAATSSHFHCGLVLLGVLSAAVKGLLWWDNGVEGRGQATVVCYPERLPPKAQSGLRQPNFVSKVGKCSESCEAK